MKVMQDIKRLFRRLTPVEVASHELVEAELSRLEAQSAKEYAKSIEDYNAARVTRLRKYLETVALTESKL
jgi:hypothetical protein